MRTSKFELDLLNFLQSVRDINAILEAHPKKGNNKM